METCIQRPVSRIGNKKVTVLKSDVHLRIMTPDYQQQQQQQQQSL